MRMWPFRNPAFVLWLGMLATASAWVPYPTKDQYCMVACQESVVGLGVVFGGSPSVADGYELNECFNELLVKSVYLCGKVYCTRNQISTGSSYGSIACDGESLYNDTTRDAIDSLIPSEVASIPRLSYSNISNVALQITNTTLIPDQELFDLGYKTIAVWYDGRNDHLWYSYAMFLFWAGIVTLGICNNLISHISRAPYINVDEESCHKTNTSTAARLYRSFRARFLLPATFKQKCSVPAWQFTIPPRAESIIIVAFIALNVVLCAVSYTTFASNLYWADETLQIWRYFSDRTGYLSYSNLAISWLFAIRNNLLLWVTGWSYATFNRFHRWVARVATLQAVLHSIGYSVFTVLSSGYTGEFGFWASFNEEYWYTGVIATCAMSLMIGLSVYYLRVKVYDLFLLIHIGLALMALVNLFYHTKIFLGQYDGWLWACVAFWVFDRVCRYARLLYTTILRRGLSSDAELNDEANLIRIDVTSACKRGKATSSGYFFLYSPVTLWESHPFTIVRWKEDGGSEVSSPVDEDEKPSESKNKITTVFASDNVIDRYSLLVRPHSGYTSRLRRSLLGSAGPRPHTFLLEGPYGHSPKLSTFSDVWFFIGGTGISIAITSIYETLERNPDARINLVWSSRTPALIDTVLERELAVALRHQHFSVHAYVTRDERQLRCAAVCHGVKYQRPNVPVLLRHASQTQIGALAVAVCGPASLTDDARAAFCAELGLHGRNMSLFVESFNW